MYLQYLFILVLTPEYMLLYCSVIEHLYKKLILKQYSCYLNLGGVDVLTIGYIIYKADKVPDGPLDVTFFKQNASVARCPNFTNIREVVLLILTILCTQFQMLSL